MSASDDSKDSIANAIRVDNMLLEPLGEGHRDPFPEIRIDRSGRGPDGPDPIGPRYDTRAIAARYAVERIINRLVTLEYVYSILGLVLGLLTILGGVVLSLHGATGSTSWTASVIGLQSKVNDAAPGVILFIVGLFYIPLTRPKVHLGELRETVR